MILKSPGERTSKEVAISGRTPKPGLTRRGLAALGGDQDREAAGGFLKE